MDFLTYCKEKYYSVDKSEMVLLQAQEKINPDIKNITKEMLCIIYDVLNREPSCYWDKTVYQQTYNQLKNISSGLPAKINLNEEIMEHFLIGYNTYRQITDIINDLSNLNDSPEIKNRLYRIPTYISVVEGCLTNLFRVIILVLDQTTKKDFASNKKLNPICEILKSNGFELLVSDVNINIRNAINHGGIIFKENGNQIDFQYTEKGKSVITSKRSFEFDTLINKVYDVASGVLLGLSIYFNENFELISLKKNEKLFIQFSLMAMELSMPTIRCKCISELPDNKQINIDIYIQDSDRTVIIHTAIILSLIVHERYNDYEQYMFFFSNERLQGSWMRFTNQEINDLAQNKREVEEVYNEILKREDCIIFEASVENIDLQEVKYYSYPNYSKSDFKINRVEDASLPDRKRLKAHLYIGDTTNKEQILEIIQKAIDWLKMVKNVPAPTMRIKHGNMEADSLYINVYREDARKNKELYSSNENFVCLVDYNIDGVTTLKDGGLPVLYWRQLYHEQIGNVQFAWREGKYAVKKKLFNLGRNEPCPCGSGKKYKKCCIDKGLY